jgi:hypothetical protein
MSVCPSACPPVWRLSPAGRISVKFHIGDFVKKSVKNFQIWLNGIKISATLHEDLSTAYCRRH